MVVNGDGEHLFGGLLAADILVELPHQFGGCGNLVLAVGGLGRLALLRFPGFLGRVQLLDENVSADINALIADIHAGSGDEFLDL